MNSDQNKQRVREKEGERDTIPQKNQTVLNWTKQTKKSDKKIVLHNIWLQAKQREIFSFFLLLFLFLRNVQYKVYTLEQFGGYLKKNIESGV